MRTRRRPRPPAPPDHVAMSTAVATSGKITTGWQGSAGVRRSRSSRLGSGTRARGTDDARRSLTHGTRIDNATLYVMSSRHAYIIHSALEILLDRVNPRVALSTWSKRLRRAPSPSATRALATQCAAHVYNIPEYLPHHFPSLAYWRVNETLMQRSRTKDARAGVMDVNGGAASPVIEDEVTVGCGLLGACDMRRWLPTSKTRECREQSSKTRWQYLAVCWPVHSQPTSQHTLFCRPHRCHHPPRMV